MAISTSMDTSPVADRTNLTNVALVNPLSAMQTTTSSTVQPQYLIENAFQIIDRYLQTDCKFHQLHELLKASSDYPTVSGLQDSDYPNVGELSASLNNLPQLNKLITIPFSSHILQQFNHAFQNCEMGLFTEIGRAWLVIDSTIFLWCYDNGSDIAFYNELNEAILTVALIKPKPGRLFGAFKDVVKYVLCLTTFVEIIILGVCYSGDGPGNLLFNPEALFKFPTDNVMMQVIKGTTKGRIFLGGNDGCLYEVIYQTNESWISSKLASKTRKINHSASTLSFLVPSFLNFYENDAILQIEVDEKRNILYTRSEKGTIEVWDLGIDGQSTSRVCSKSAHSISSQAASIARTVEAVNFRIISSINIVEESESIFINLVAFTSTGVRIYFSTTRVPQPGSRPDSLNIVHIRLPPGYCASSLAQRPVNIHMAHYRRGTSLMISSTLDSKSILWTSSSDTFAFDNQLMESFTVSSINSRVWRLGEEIKPPNIRQFNSVSIGLNRTILLEPPLLVTQEMEEQRKYVLLSSQGVHIAYKPRPADHLKQLLSDNQGFDNEAVKGFFQLYGEAQGCAIALTLACSSNTVTDQQICEWATFAYYRYGSDLAVSGVGSSTANMLANQSIGSITTIGPQQHNSYFSLGSPSSMPIASTPYHRGLTQTNISPNNQTLVNQSRMLTPLQMTGLNQSMNSSVLLPNNTVINQAEITYSNKLAGMCIYISRILRPIWNYNVVRGELVSARTLGENSDKPREVLKSMISNIEMAVYLKKLNNIKEFMQKYICVDSNDASLPFSNLHSTVNAYEKIVFSNILSLINGCIETLGLLVLVYEHNFEIIASKLTTEQFNQLKNFTFRDLFISGLEICASLASALVSKYINDEKSTDGIASRLNDSCPSIFKQENAMHARCHEMLLKAKSSTDKNEKNRLINDAVNTFKKIGARINISQAVELMRLVDGYPQIVELCLDIAKSRDKDNAGLSYYKAINGIDQDGRSASIKDSSIKNEEYARSVLQSRLECYNVLLDVYAGLESTKQFSVTPRTEAGDKNSSQRLSSDDAANFSSLVFKAIIASKDELLHIVLYDWLYERQSIDLLLSISSPHLEHYLKHKIKNFSQSTQLMDMLWMFYERNGNYHAAAVILDKLAEKPSNEICLYKRLEYLSRAILSMKSVPSSMGWVTDSSQDDKRSGEFLHQLEERMEVARIQLKIKDALSAKDDGRDPVIQAAIASLHSELFTITTLYENYAEKFDLPECQLAILHSASYYDVALVESLWKRIIDKELEKNVARPPDVHKISLSTKISELANLYISSEKYFPTEFIVHYLEKKTADMNIERHWLASVLLSVGISISSLVDTYHRLYKSRDQLKSWPSKSIHILQISCFLFKSFLDRRGLVESKDRNKFVAKCLDVVSSYLIDLQSNYHADLKATEIAKTLRSIQAKLDKSFN